MNPVIAIMTGVVVAETILVLVLLFVWVRGLRRRRSPSPQARAGDRVVWRRSPEHVRQQERVESATAGRPRQGRVRYAAAPRASRRTMDDR